MMRKKAKTITMTVTLILAIMHKSLRRGDSDAELKRKEHET